MIPQKDSDHVASPVNIVVILVGRATMGTPAVLQIDNLSGG